METSFTGQDIDGVLSSLRGGRILDLQHLKNRRLIQRIGLEKSFGPTDYRALVPNFVRETLERVNGDGPVLYSAVSLQPDFTVQTLSYFHARQRVYRVAINAVAIEFGEEELDRAGVLNEVPSFETFKIIRLAPPLMEGVTSDISDTIGRMREYLAGHGVDDDQYRSYRHFEGSGLW